MSDTEKNSTNSRMTPEKLSRLMEEAQDELSAMVCNKLKEQYGKDFILLDTIADPGISCIKCIIRTKEEPVVVFYAMIDENGMMSESYVRQTCANSVKKDLSGLFSDAIISVSLLDENEPESNTNLSPAEYIRLHAVIGMLVRIYVQENASANWENTLRVLAEAGKFYGTDIAVYYYVLKEEMYKQCADSLRHVPSLTGAMIKDLSPINTFSSRIGHSERTGR